MISFFRVSDNGFDDVETTGIDVLPKILFRVRVDLMSSMSEGACVSNKFLIWVWGYSIL
jgi:hypothetical protein